MSKKKIIAVASHGPALTSIQTTMNTTPTTKAKPTLKGLVKSLKDKPFAERSSVRIANDNTVIYVSVKVDSSLREATEKAELTADIMREAGTVYHETNLTPRELVELLKKALPYLHDMEQDNIEDRAVGLFKDYELKELYETIKALATE